MPRRVAAAVAVVAAVAVLSGCEDAHQRDARRAVQAYLRGQPGAGGYDVGDVHCTRDARLVLDPQETTRFYCAAPRRRDGDCDWLRVDARAGRPLAIVVVRRGGGCVLPGE